MTILHECPRHFSLSLRRKGRKVMVLLVEAKVWVWKSPLLVLIAPIMVMD
jgi:hypothetical protein